MRNCHKHSYHFKLILILMTNEFDCFVSGNGQNTVDGKYCLYQSFYLLKGQNPKLVRVFMILLYNNVALPLQQRGTRRTIIYKVPHEGLNQKLLQWHYNYYFLHTFKQPVPFRLPWWKHFLKIVTFNKLKKEKKWKTIFRQKNVS